MLELLVTKLEELTNIQRQLLQYAERKKAVLIERSIDELTEMVQGERKLVKELGQLEKERVQLVDKVLESHPNVTFREFLAGISDRELRVQLESQLNTLQGLMTELQMKNKLNEQLLKDSMNFVHQMIDQVTQSQKQQFNYQSPQSQQKSESSSHGFFDTRA